MNKLAISTFAEKFLGFRYCFKVIRVCGVKKKKKFLFFGKNI